MQTDGQWLIVFNAPGCHFDYSPSDSVLAVWLDTECPIRGSNSPDQEAINHQFFGDYLLILLFYGILRMKNNDLP
jgi:hypothetical protein